MDFGAAIKALKNGHHVARSGWNGKGIFIELQRPEQDFKMTHSYIYIDSTGLQTTNPQAPKDRVPWVASQTDMIAEDWVIVTERESKTMPQGIAVSTIKPFLEELSALTRKYKMLIWSETPPDVLDEVLDVWHHGLIWNESLQHYLLAVNIDEVL